ncbi:Frataxin-like protein [Terfezia boudieri ATCC MYA-4762]|uniref:Frataxin-like protein n=1 Tax=Terfezia boudieri ATCC MYA-4762 TaxID=1051890 RepID=A0A3N4L923_9PEZI|nr:Frataxin-like protein [Terfezia boudieri ATCC MYA-4762]
MPSRIPTSLFSACVRPRWQCILPRLPHPLQASKRSFTMSRGSIIPTNLIPTSSPLTTALTRRNYSDHASTTRKYTPTPLDSTTYQRLSSTTLDTLLSSLEDLAEVSPSPESNNQVITDVEFSAGVLTVVVEGKGTWVVNKQPPNRQMWLSSPISGPRRFDWRGKGDVASGTGGVVRMIFIRELKCTR